MRDLSGIDAVVLCGGRGTRLENVEKNLPKALVQINGTPFLEILLKFFKRQSLRRVILCVGYKAESIEAFIERDNFGLDILLSREEKALGTAGALTHAKSLIKSDPFFVFNGDSLCAAELAVHLDFHCLKKALASIEVSEVTDHQDFGTIEINAQQKITCFKEKGQSSTSNALVNAGIYCFDQKIFSYIPNQFPVSLEYDVFPKIIQKQFYGFAIKTPFFDIGTPQRYQDAQEKLKGFLNE
ncbi:MAG: NTP transferase domain-containing protein [Candidatus Omnitrophica bacterium]|nr:NTP transferase domain-containing protein [Candidatus Omnitrophota bacterium]